MPDLIRKPQETNTLMVRLGSWFEARASGWGVVALAMVLLIILSLGALQLLAP